MIRHFATGVRKFRRRLRHPRFIVDKNQVDIGTRVEFPAAQLSHADHHQILRHTDVARRYAETPRQIPGMHPHGRRYRNFG